MNIKPSIEQALSVNKGYLHMYMISDQNSTSADGGPRLTLRSAPNRH
jgi:hypothetical protein